MRQIFETADERRIEQLRYTIHKLQSDDNLSIEEKGGRIREFFKKDGRGEQILDSLSPAILFEAAKYFLILKFGIAF